MYKILTVVAVVALVALSTSIVATVLLHSQSHQIGAIQRAENADHKKLVALEGALASASNDKKLAAARLLCTQVHQPMGQPGLALAAPELLFTIRQDSLTAWNALAGIPLSNDTNASGHCG